MRLSQNSFPPVAMNFKKALRHLIAAWLPCKRHVKLVLQVAAALALMQAWGRTCHKINGTANDEQLREYGVKKWYSMFRRQRCFCPSGMYHSIGRGKFEQVKDINGELWLSFRLGAADSTCKCPDPCRVFKGTASDEELENFEVKRSQNRCFCPKEMYPSKVCWKFEQVKDINYQRRPVAILSPWSC